MAFFEIYQGHWIHVGGLLGRADRILLCGMRDPDFMALDTATAIGDWKKVTCPTCQKRMDEIATRFGWKEERPDGRKDDQGKNRLGLLPPLALEAVGRVLTFGARKYAPENWRKVPDAKARYLDATLRHVVSYMKGERMDPETGESHLAHAACCLLFLLELDDVAR